MRKLEYNSVKLKPDPNIISLISIHKCRVQQRTEDTFARHQHVHGHSQPITGNSFIVCEQQNQANNTFDKNEKSLSCQSIRSWPCEENDDEKRVSLMKDSWWIHTYSLLSELPIPHVMFCMSSLRHPSRSVRQFTNSNLFCIRICFFVFLSLIWLQIIPIRGRKAHP